MIFKCFGLDQNPFKWLLSFVFMIGGSYLYRIESESDDPSIGRGGTCVARNCYGAIEKFIQAKEDLCDITI